MNKKELWGSLTARQRVTLKMLGRQTTPDEGSLDTGDAVPFGTGRSLKRNGLALYIPNVGWRVSELGRDVLASEQQTIRR